MASAASFSTPGKFAALSLIPQHLGVKGNLKVVNGGSAARTATRRTIYLLFSQRECAILPVGNQNGGLMKQKSDVLQGTLALMVLKTLDVLGPQHGYGIARRIEQISGDLLAVNQGTLYPVLLKLEQEGSVASEWGASENNRRARFYRLTREGRKQLQVETQDWEQTAAIIGRFFEAKAEDLS
jgi:PadR family transcriptional regulator PadR